MRREGEGRRILVIEDSRVVRNLLRHWLGRLGYTIVEAQNGPQGLAAIEAGDVDLVICDINMPGLTGLTILDRVRKDPALNQLPFVLLTTMGREEDVRRGEDLGCSAYLTKPLLHGRLVATLRGLLQPAS
jgi:CheY-like chemotaxis protein